MKAGELRRPSPPHCCVLATPAARSRNIQDIGWNQLQLSEKVGKRKQKNWDHVNHSSTHTVTQYPSRNEILSFRALEGNTNGSMMLNVLALQTSQTCLPSRKAEWQNKGVCSSYMFVYCGILTSENTWHVYRQARCHGCLENHLGMLRIFQQGPAAVHCLNLYSENSRPKQKAHCCSPSCLAHSCCGFESKPGNSGLKQWLGLTSHRSPHAPRCSKCSLLFFFRSLSWCLIKVHWSPSLPVCTSIWLEYSLIACMFLYSTRSPWNLSSLSIWFFTWQVALMLLTLWPRQLGHCSDTRRRDCLLSINLNHDTLTPWGCEGLCEAREALETIWNNPSCSYTGKSALWG